MSGLSKGMARRRLHDVIEARSGEEPVIAIHGPRLVGKSTLLRDFAARHNVGVIDLDDPASLDAARANPTQMMAGDRPVCLDEYQKAPELLDALKTRMSREGALPGTAVLTGSTRHEALPLTAQALTGRLHALNVLPLSQGEIAGDIEDLVVALFDDPDAAVAAYPTSTTTRQEYVDRLCAGGFPLALRREGSARNRWFDDFVRQSLERDALELQKVRQRAVLRSLLNRLAGQTAQILNVSNAMAGLDTTRPTADGYVRLLEDLFLVVQLPAWGKTLRARAAAKPKIHVVDSGLAARLMRINPQKLVTLDPTVVTEFGNLLETFVVGELTKQASWLPESPILGHWRTGDDDEVDLVIENDEGRVLAFEVKANERVPGSDLKGLRKLREALGDNFIAGVALSTGARSYTFEDRLHVMPIDRLWRPVNP
ncbi:MAG: DUF4143 domain-containing protein [Actinobacteria bacterium]|uniref:Unannotated protein n=1 Tax=freshwater metagenome TaxID=449393 RepID=A0A6J7M4Q0_9ZZZZ|nr:DUF4143 domain-containing protein [Actinomycetota bacterium]